MAAGRLVGVTLGGVLGSDAPADGDPRVPSRVLGTVFARADDPWVLSGANVHISFVGQDDGAESERELDGLAVDSINSNLTHGVDLTLARRLRED